MRRQTLCICLVLVLASAVRAEQIPLIADPHFDRGFEVLDPTPGALVVQGNLQWDTSAGPPIWQLGQWNSQSTIFGVTPTLQPSGALAYVNADKQIIAGGGPAATESDLILTINGQNEYGGVFRGISDPWPHLLVSQGISGPGGHLGSQAPSIADMASLDFQIDARLLYDNQITTGGYDPSIHASQYNIFYTVQNLNTASTGFGDFLWFGTSLYDDRVDVTGQVVLVDGFSQKLIYGIGIEPFTSEKIADGNWMTIGGDLLPHMKAALQEAWSQGLLLDSQDFADYKIGGANLGWEMPGLNDASLQIRNYSVTATVGVPSTPGDFNDDGNVNGDDLTDPIEGWEARFGFNLDGSDFLDWQQNFGTVSQSIAGAIAVPEPATGLLMLVAMIGIICRHGRRTPSLLNQILNKVILLLMKTQTFFIRLATVVLLLSPYQLAQAEIPFVFTYFDSTYFSIESTAAEYNQMAAVGINVAKDSSFGIDLDLVQASGMQGMVDFNVEGVFAEVDPTPADGLTNADKLWIDSRAESLASQYGSHPALLGYYLTDEPSADEFEALAYVQQKLLQYDPDALPVLALYPNYATPSQLGVATYDEYVSSFVQTVHPKVLAFDHYLYDDSHYDNLATIRYYGLQEDIPYWNIYLATPIRDILPDPTAGQLRWQMYTALAYGFKGLSSFTYTTPNAPEFTEAGSGLITAVTHEPTPKYYIVQDIYAEIENLAPVLNNLTSDGVYHTNPPAGATGLDNLFVTDISGGEMVYGSFVDDSSRSYLMFVNKSFENGHDFTIQLNPATIADLGKYDKETGHLHLASTPGNSLSLSLAAGDGELYKVLLDTTLALTPNNLLGTPQSTTEIDLSWDPSVDFESGIDFYYIYRDGVEIATSVSAFYSDIGLLPGASYQYRISAVNGEGLESALSNVLWSGEPPTPGDFNGDGVVDGDDLTGPIDGWETRFGADLNGGDFLDWQRNFGTVSPPTAAAIAIPEPATGLLMWIAVIGIISRHGHRNIWPPTYSY